MLFFSFVRLEVVKVQIESVFFLFFRIVLTYENKMKTQLSLENRRFTISSWHLRNFHHHQRNPKLELMVDQDR